MHGNWLEVRYEFVLGAAAWLAGSAIPLNAAPQFQSPVENRKAPVVDPLVVENPYLKHPPVQPASVPPTPVAPPANVSPTGAPPNSSADRPTPEPRLPVPVVGAMVDSKAPVPYRLPNVSSFAPTPVDAESTPVPRVVMPPQPPSDEPVAAAPSVAEPQLRSDISLPQLESSNDQVQKTAEADRDQEQSLLQDSLTQTELPLPPGPDMASPPGPAPEVVRNHNSGIEPISPVAPDHAPTALELTSQLLPAVQRGFDLAQRGALFAAQTEFVQVLRRVAQAKDTAAHSDEHSRALAAGLRALDEAEDFVPDGTQLEAELDLKIVASSHRTPVLRNHPQGLLAHQAAALYASFAQAQLARAVSGEQAGSIALHGLGKIYARLAERNDDDVQFTRRATAMHTAALMARPDNHLAANELGVLLCRSGRPADAALLFERTIDGVPNSLAYHNLAVAQRKLGMHGQADANERESQRLAAWERTTGAVSQRAGVEWVTPAEMSRVAQPAPLTPAAYSASAPNVAAPQPNVAPPLSEDKSPWRKVAEFGRSLSLPNLDSTKNIRNAHPQTRVARPFAAQPSHGVIGPGVYR